MDDAAAGARQVSSSLFWLLMSSPGADGKSAGGESGVGGCGLGRWPCMQGLMGNRVLREQSRNEPDRQVGKGRERGRG